MKNKILLGLFIFVAVTAILDLSAYLYLLVRHYPMEVIVKLGLFIVVGVAWVIFISYSGD